MTQRQLAERAGVQQPVISAYESGRRQPSLPMLQKLLAATGHRLDLGLESVRVLPDPARAGRVLPMVLDLAATLPSRRRAARLEFPRLPNA